MDDKKIVAALHRLASHYGRQNWWQSENKVEDLVSMVLIQRTTERNAVLAMENLPANLSLEDLLTMPIEDLQERIRPAGFFSSKSQTIKTLAQFVLDGGGFAGFDQIETLELRKQLLALKGIGPETADVILLYIFDRKVFVADEYARRLFARLGFGEFPNYETMKKETQHLAELVSLETCKEWHAVIDEHGKAYCRVKGELDESWLVEGEEYDKYNESNRYL